MSERWGDVKWGDVDPDGEFKSPESASGPQVFYEQTPLDENGIKTVIETHMDETGKKTRITRKVKVVKKVTKVKRGVIARRKWVKFGDCKGFPPGPEKNVTYHTIENINLKLRPKKREEEKQEDALEKLKGTDSVVVCRNCGETGHWTLKCPKRNQIAPVGSSSSSSNDVRKAGESSGKFVPSRLREGAKRMVDEGTTIRVTNISEDANEDDLRDLFRPFGHTSRVYLAKDRNTGASRGFAFISYLSRESAQMAIDKLNGYGYDNLILHVEFSKPREEDPNRRR